MAATPGVTVVTAAEMVAATVVAATAVALGGCAMPGVAAVARELAVEFEPDDAPLVAAAAVGMCPAVSEDIAVAAAALEANPQRPMRAPSAGAVRETVTATGSIPRDVTLVAGATVLEPASGGKPLAPDVIRSAAPAVTAGGEVAEAEVLAASTLVLGARVGSNSPDATDAEPSSASGEAIATVGAVAGAATGAVAGAEVAAAAAGTGETSRSLFHWRNLRMMLWKRPSSFFGGAVTGTCLGAAAADTMTDDADGAAIDEVVADIDGEGPDVAPGAAEDTAGSSAGGRGGEPDAASCC